MIEELLMRNYKIELSRLEGEDGEGWFAEAPDLKGCCADGVSVEEALANLQEAKKAWFQAVLEQGGNIPEVPTNDPLSFRGYSGRFVIRIPQSLHARIAKDSKQNRVSLNQYVNTLIACGMGVLSKHQGKQSHEIDVRIEVQRTSFEFNQSGWRSASWMPNAEKSIVFAGKRDESWTTTEN